MTTESQKLQTLLRQLFQFDCADLDFGIYRIMNFKRDAIERFIQKELIEAISKELCGGVLASQSQASAELQQVAKQVRETLGEAAIDDEGELLEAFHTTPLGGRYLDLQARASGAHSYPALEAMTFNHLYAFFSRYYDSGDFLSKRRYSRNEKYAIPYNGEEVYLHWANHDQYYIKTGEYFTDYRFKAPNGVFVHFKLKQADVEQNNVKGEDRFFFPLSAKAAFDGSVREIVIPFEYRPLTQQEQVTYGQRNQKENILAQAPTAISEALKMHTEALAALGALHHRTADGTDVLYLEHHLRQYTRRNTSDFFIHKDLKGFLTRELDFYLKNEVLNLDELEAAGELRAEGWFQIMRVIKTIGGRIIEFLAQIENFQKMLFEKRKLITETQYCVTVGNIAEACYADIAACDAQWQEWKALFHIDEEQKDLFTAGKTKKHRRVAFLKSQPTLVLDTKHFDADFVDRLLASFDDLDGMTDGLLVHSENFQALNLLLEKYRGKIEGIYIDPPYNTDAGPINYKNGYRSSSWMSLIENRLASARALLADRGVLCVTIDDYQVHELARLLDQVFGRENQLGTVVIRNNPSGRATLKGLSICHEYALFYGNGESSLRRLPRSDKQLERFTVEAGVYVNWLPFLKGGGAVTYRTARPRQFYPIYIAPKGKSLRIPALLWNTDARRWDVLEEQKEHEVVVLPIDDKGQERVWSLNHISALKHLADLEVRINNDGAPQLFRRHRPADGVLPRSWWDKNTYAAREHGSAALAHLFGAATFSFAKSPYAVQDCIWVSGLADESSAWVLDFFAGSGTTGHAAINLNRQDGGERRFILVEMGDYFDTVLLPRIKKVTFSPDWKDGKSKRQATAEEAERSPRIVKYIRLESYEDALNNIEVNGQAGQAALKFDDYMLSYMLDWETRESPTRLNLKQLASPFAYKLSISHQQETLDQVVDIPETFAHLLGIHIRTRRVYDDNDRRYLVYRGALDHREVVVIWRDTAEWEQKDYERDKAFVAEQKLAEGADEVFVNGDSLIPGARSLDGVFKSRMFAPVEA